MNKIYAKVCLISGISINIWACSDKEQAPFVSTSGEEATNVGTYYPPPADMPNMGTNSGESMDIGRMGPISGTEPGTESGETPEAGVEPDRTINVNSPCEGLPESPSENELCNVIFDCALGVCPESFVDDEELRRSCVIEPMLASNLCAITCTDIAEISGLCQ